LTSGLGAELYDDGYTNITNIDTSLVVINQMNDRYSDREEMECKFVNSRLIGELSSVTCMDATNLEHIPDDCFDIILDKALLDTLLCHENNLQKVEDYLAEIYRVLKSSGVVLIVSHGLPENRLDYFDEEKWVVEPVPIRKNHLHPPPLLLYLTLPLPYSAKPPVRSRLDQQELSQDHFLFICKKI
jgi:EEF1A lysine methyltransferase 4